jgi:hypothetical protein
LFFGFVFASLCFGLRVTNVFFRYDTLPSHFVSCQLPLP